MAREAGLDFVAITDHNNTTHAVDVPPDPHGKPLHIVGEEITTPGGHANVWGLRPGDWIDFRVAADDQRINDLAAAASARGALFSINHPVADCDACDWKQPIPPQTARSKCGTERSDRSRGQLRSGIVSCEAAAGSPASPRATGIAPPPSSAPAVSAYSRNR